MKNKRTQAQLDFDLAKHGWAFCNKAMLRARIAQCEKLAEKLEADDERHDLLETMRGALLGAKL